MDVRAALEQALDLHRQGRLADAERLYVEVLHLAPGDANALHLTGVVAMQTGDLPRALVLMDRALAINPQMAGAHYNRGVVLRGLERPADAIASFEAAIALKPDYAEAFSGRGAALHDLHRLTEADESLARAIALNPRNADAYSNQAKVLLDLGRPRDAITQCDKAIALSPGFAEGYVNKSLSLLTLGDYKQGFELYEWRAAVVPSIGARAGGRPRWTGQEDVAGKTIFLTWEQGFGDTIQFCRYIPRVAALGARVVASVQEPLRRLLAQLGPDIDVVGENETPEAFDYTAPLMSLPRAFKETLETIKAPPRYLQADADDALRWRKRLADRSGAKVGLVWAGGAKLGNLIAAVADARRSIRLADLAPLGKARGVSFVSLQKGPAATQGRAAPFGLFDATDELSDFADTAALVEALDLVITVDTAVAHLAGALGKPVWILNRFDTCWRWMLGRDDSPWYPSVRLFRQPAPGDWTSVIDRVGDELIGRYG
jgi:tetratricopeptide (TPR) repeat protein